MVMVCLIKLRTNGLALKLLELMYLVYPLFVIKCIKCYFMMRKYNIKDCRVCTMTLDTNRPWIFFFLCCSSVKYEVQTVFLQPWLLTITEDLSLIILVCKYVLVKNQSRQKNGSVVRNTSLEDLHFVSISNHISPHNLLYREHPLCP